MFGRLVVIAMLCAWCITAWADAAPQAALWPGEAPPPATTAKQDRVNMLTLLNVAGTLAFAPTAIASGPKYVYLLRNGVVVQYDGTTQEPVNQLALYGTAPATPAADAPLADRLKYAMDAVKRLEAATMLVHEDYLVIVTADMVFCLDATSLKPISAASLALPGQVQRIQQAAITTAPVAQVAGHIAYVMQANDRVISVDFLTGTVLGRGKLPPAMTPPTMQDLFINEINQPAIGVWPGGGVAQPVLQ